MHNKIILFKMCCFILVITIMTGCSKTTNNDIPQQKHISTTDNTTLEFSSKDFLTDYDELWKILEENYIYFPVLKERGIDIASLKNFTRQQLQNRITDLDGFIYILNTMFGEMQNFAHLGIVTPDIFDAYQAYYNNAENTNINEWKKVLQNPQTQAIYQHMKNSSTVSSLPKSNFHDVETFYDAPQKSVTFIINTFDSTIVERDKYLVSQYIASLGDSKIEHIIFDLSGNTGGNDQYWHDNIVAPFGGTYEWSDWWYLRDTELTQSYFFSDFSPEPIHNISEHSLPTFVKELELTHFIKVQKQLSSQPTLKEDILKAKRWVIIDNKVYSAADSFSSFCKTTGWATLVGQTTSGDGQGISPLLICLPNTGLLVRFSGVAAETPNGTLNAVTGTEPDIKIDLTIETPHDTINRLISNTNV